MNKIVNSCNEALMEHIRDGMTIMFGGFGLCGIPEHFIYAIEQSNVKDITAISNNCGVDDFGLGLLLKNKQIKRFIGSYVGENKKLESLIINGEIEVELVPQGTLAERIRAAGAGIPAFFTKTGVGTDVAANKEVATFDGVQYLMEKAIKADMAIIKGCTGDYYGNVIYNKTARNFNPVMATAADIVLCEVENLVDSIDPDSIHTPGIFIDKMVVCGNYQKRIERAVFRN